VARVWDLSRIAVGFSYFGLGGWVLAACVLPLQRLVHRWRGRDDADLRAQRTVHAGARSFLGLARRMGLVQVEWRHDAAIDRGPVLVVANHPSLIDSPIFAARMRQVDFLVSPAWSTNPWLRGLVTAAGYVRTEDGAASVQEAAARLRAGRSVVVYPEGTRTAPEGMGRLHRGAAHVALEAGCDLLPVWIRTTPRTLMKGQSWTDYPAASRPRWIVEVGAPIRPAEHLDGSEPRALAARRLTGILRDWFEARSGREAREAGIGAAPADAAGKPSRAAGRRGAAGGDAVR
jgi:1-acyl-sn-glycerol-3-phosphate acyltransferase